jgi:hypothetical protein
MRKESGNDMSNVMKGDIFVILGVKVYCFITGTLEMDARGPRLHFNSMDLPHSIFNDLIPQVM